ncbi:peptide chain release factor N(5)-glutamine methyltransferase [Piscinibacter sp. HJYY11]|uniref:peptide chain release factor N(5)-glutamine methyltransferase n=1 Tax=Piscinibacter sp. HJYY11 TaxID=2801333 RepID=UPI00191FCFDD|nr:peptide chain release factor N(5)-glutamine methyltransferase [Piscinibacter sp. HJYY11]MBL0730135.1 peptide chain release factor N(5)-glutamine methyltransferase [Piscinibacter sp. HJYY11]
MTRIADALAHARALRVDRLDAQLLLEHVLQRPRSWLLAHDEVSLTESQASNVAALLQRRAQGEPLAYLTGEKEFHGLMLQVTPDVLIPRPDTETLVDWALALLQGGPLEPRVLDLGTGSGAIALALKHRHPSATVTAIDTSDAALSVAEANAQRLGLDIRFVLGSWWSGAKNQQFDLVVSNPPYIALGDKHLPALRHEPELALTSGVDGLDALRAIVSDAPAHLASSGWLLLEHGHDQSQHVRALLLAAGFANVQTREDLAGIGRCTGGQWR